MSNAADATDLAHETFSRVIGKQSSELDALREPRAWLTSLAKGLVVDHWRRREALHFGGYGGFPMTIIWMVFDLIAIAVLTSALYLWWARGNPSAAG